MYTYSSFIGNGPPVLEPDGRFRDGSVIVQYYQLPTPNPSTDLKLVYDFAPEESGESIIARLGRPIANLTNNADFPPEIGRQPPSYVARYRPFYGRALYIANSVPSLSAGWATPSSSPVTVSRAALTRLYASECGSHVLNVVCRPSSR